MKAITLFILSLVLATTATNIIKLNKITLENIINALNVTLPENLKTSFVPDVMDKEKCQHEDFCKAEKVLSTIKHDFMKNWTVVRLLKGLNQKRNCKETMNDSGNELELKVFLEHLRQCIQKIYPQV